MVKQYCTVLHKRALINNLGGRVSNQLQSGQESYGLSDSSGKRKVCIVSPIFFTFSRSLIRFYFQCEGGRDREQICKNDKRLATDRLQLHFFFVCIWIWGMGALGRYWPPCRFLGAPRNDRPDGNPPSEKSGDQRMDRLVARGGTLVLPPLFSLLV